MRAESAVEPTRSENITVTWRRSAVSSSFNSAGYGRAPKLLDSREHYPPMREQHANVLKVLIGQMAKCCETNPVFSKTLGVLGHAELLEPVGNLLHCAHPTDLAQIFLDQQN